MKSQKDLIQNGNWDVLIVLDACRYDYFKNNYGKYFDEKQVNLEKVRSEGSHTEEWLEKTFSGTSLNDTVYFSANPFINSKGIRGSPAKEVFDTVIDVWDWGWNAEYGTVLPETVEKSFLKKKDRHEGKRFVLHFEQPHAPYLSLDYTETREGKLDKFRALLGGKLVDALGRKRVMGLRRELRRVAGEILPSEKKDEGTESPSTKLVAEKYGIDVLKESYQKNLHSALKSVGHIIDILDSWIVITSDHGEMLGEDNLYGHFRSSDHPTLREVPWLEVESLI